MGDSPVSDPGVDATRLERTTRKNAFFPGEMTPEKLVHFKEAFTLVGDWGWHLSLSLCTEGEMAAKRKKKKAAKRTATKKKATKKKAAKKKATKKKATKKAAKKKAAKKKAAPKKKKAAKKKSKRTPSPAFMKALQPDAALSAVIGNKAMPRTEVTKKLWVYIKRNGLQDSVNRRMINADDRLRPVFNGRSQVSMFEMTKLVNAHLS